MNNQTVMEITQTLDSMFELNQMIYDYWVSHLFEDGGDTMIKTSWNSQTLRLMQKDLAEQFALMN